MVVPVEVAVVSLMQGELQLFNGRTLGEGGARAEELVAGVVAKVEADLASCGRHCW
jgi:hypothetical protein